MGSWREEQSASLCCIGLASWIWTMGEQDTSMLQWQSCQPVPGWAAHSDHTHRHAPDWTALALPLCRLNTVCLPVIHLMARGPPLPDAFPSCAGSWHPAVDRGWAGAQSRTTPPNLRDGSVSLPSLGHSQTPPGPPPCCSAPPRTPSPGVLAWSPRRSGRLAAASAAGTGRLPGRAAARLGGQEQDEEEERSRSKGRQR